MKTLPTPPPSASHVSSAAHVPSAESASDMETVSCPLCQSSRYQAWLEAPDLKAPGSTYTIVRCDDCGFRFTNPRPTYEAIAEHYGASYYSYRPTRRRERPQDQWNGQRFLDIGCGSGDYMIRMRNRGYDVSGIELDPTVVEAACERGLDVRCASREGLPFDDESFDHIRTNHVLEHIHDVHDLLDEIHRCLKPGGLYELAVPNIDSFDARLFGKWWRAIDTPRHLYHFTPESLERLLLAHHFEAIDWVTVDRRLITPQLDYLKGCGTSLRASLRVHTKPGVLRTAGASIATAFRVVRYALHRARREDGANIYVLARKPLS